MLFFRLFVCAFILYSLYTYMHMYIPKGYIHGFFLTSLCSSQGILGQSGVEGDPGEPGSIVSFSY